MYRLTRLKFVELSYRFIEVVEPYMFGCEPGRWFTRIKRQKFNVATVLF